MTSMNAEVNHWPVSTEIPRSRFRAGRATPMIVSLRMTMKAETNNSGMTNRSARGLRCGSAASEAGGVGCPVTGVLGVS